VWVGAWGGMSKVYNLIETYKLDISVQSGYAYNNEAIILG